MAPVIFFRDTLETYSQELVGMGRTTKTEKSFFFGPSLMDSDVLEKAIRNTASYPALMLEYSDNAVDSNNKTGTVETIPFGISIIANYSPKDSSSNKDELIYGVCKPLLDQTLARLQKESDKHLLKSGCSFEIQLMRSFNGMWIGPIANGVYGYNYSIEIRVFGSLMYDPNSWIIPA
jgi:hypothetical protein